MEPISTAADRLIDIASGVAPATLEPVTDERRVASRHPYNALVAVVLTSADGTGSRPMLLRTRNISMGGLCVVSRHMLHPETTGAVQLVRSDGTMAVVGVRVTHCRYVGNMEHETGLRFIPLPSMASIERFFDEREQRLRLADPLLRENVRVDEGEGGG